MPTPNPTLRREYKGAAAATTLQNSMTNTDTSFVLVAANNWPTGAVGKFIVTINRGLADEEKILCDSQTSRSVACLLANRGFDSTTPQAHAAGATVECTISAFDADEWNQHTNATTGVHGVAGAVVGTTDVQALSNKTIDAASTIGGVSGTALAADRTAWTAWTPAATNVTTSSTAGHFLQVGKTVRATGRIVLSGAPSSVIEVSLPANAALPFGANDFACGQAFFSHSGTKAHGTVFLVSDGTNRVYFNAKLDVGFSDVGPTTPWTWASGDAIAFTITYEAA